MSPEPPTSEEKKRVAKWVTFLFWVNYPFNNFSSELINVSDQTAAVPRKAVRTHHDFRPQRKTRASSESRAVQTIKPTDSIRSYSWCGVLTTQSKKKNKKTRSY